MIQKIKEKEKAIRLRKKGLSYSEILKDIPVAKSTLSLWLGGVGLSKRQKQKLTEKKLESMRRGWQACHQKRLDITKTIKDNAKKDIDKISKRDLWLMGVMLYWAEGSKEKTKGSRLNFCNSDPAMIKLFLMWLKKIMEVSDSEICLSIYLHETSRKKEKEIKKYWIDVTGFPSSCFQNIVWKKNIIKTRRKNVGESYFGLLRITVLKSTNLNRKITGWIEGVCQKIL